MTLIRPARYADDIAGLCALDTSFATDRVYRLEEGAFAFALVEEGVTPALTKTVCMLGDEIDDLRQLEHVVVADADGEIIGLAGAQYSEWNRRAVLRHLYVQPSQRGSGVGRALMESVFDYARRVGARCVWLETQNVNYPAIQFYRRQGFRLVGLDKSLYDPESVGKNEVALFFAKDVE